MSNKHNKGNKGNKGNKIYKEKLSAEVGKVLNEIPEIKIADTKDDDDLDIIEEINDPDEIDDPKEIFDPIDEDKPDEDKPDEDKPDEDKPDEDKPDEDKPDEDKAIIDDDGISILQAQIAEQELLEAQLKAKRKAIKLLAETVLTPERYQRILDSHIDKIQLAQATFDTVAPEFYLRRDELRAAEQAKEDFVKLYGSRKIQHRDGKKIGARWADTLTKTNDTLVVETTLKDHQGKFSYDLPVSPQKEILIQSWKDLRHGFIDFFDGKDDKARDLMLRAELSNIKPKIIKAGLVFID